MIDRPEYSVKVRINGRNLNRVIIDQHYKEKHADTINDRLILELIRKLDGQSWRIDDEHGEFQYFAVNVVGKDGKPYRLIFLLCTSGDYLGVINTFRVDRR